ncbi:MAG: KpsF/GutQ family sugar-phosphate isomerase [Phycisphaerales bacterium]
MTPSTANPPASKTLADERAFIEAALRAEADAVNALIPRLGPSLHDAVDLLSTCADRGGAVLVSGLGKSGIIAKKISATLASLGVPSHDVHPTEAAHGDLGRIRATDSLLALSYSGETEELVGLASLLKQDRVPILSITGGDKPTSSLAKLASVALCVGAVEEACSITLAPTSSTTAMLALGDALALAVSRRRAFTSDDFRRRHPGGGLGGLLRPVTDLLRFVVGKNLPVAADTLSVRDALAHANSLGRRPGAIILVSNQGLLSGLFTDGDLRRLVTSDHPTPLDQPISNVMTKSPRTLRDDALVRDAVRLFREHRQDEIPVVDAHGKPVGVLDVQDLVAIRVVQD